MKSAFIITGVIVVLGLAYYIYHLISKEGGTQANVSNEASIVDLVKGSQDTAAAKALLRSKIEAKQKEIDDTNHRIRHLAGSVAWLGRNFLSRKSNKSRIEQEESERIYLSTTKLSELQAQLTELQKGMLI